MRPFVKAFVNVNGGYLAGATLRHSAILVESESGCDSLYLLLGFAGGATVSKAAIAGQIVLHVSSDLGATLIAHGPDQNLIVGNRTWLCKLQRVHR